MPNEIRFTPAALKAASFSLSTVSGFVSRVISQSSLNPNFFSIAFITRPISDGSIRDGVPPPKKIVGTVASPTWA